jgi:hypothetical protein
MDGSMTQITFKPLGTCMELSGASITLMSCERCRAVVSKADSIEHAEWHHLLQKHIASIEYGEH